jgi:hypothetical protein
MIYFINLKITEERRDTSKVVVEKLEGRRPLGRPRRR